jgi:hypothetical protein
VEQVFRDEQPRLIPLPLHPFQTDRIETVCSRKTIYVRFDLNDYSIPPEAVGRPLTLVASDTAVRILDGATEIARHIRSYDRQQQVLDPSHRDAVLQLKHKAFHATPAGRLEQAVPESTTLLDLAFAQGESAGSQTSQLLKLLEEYGPAALRRAIVEAATQHAARLLGRLPATPPARAPRVALTSAATRKRNRSTFDRMTWRSTMSSPALKTTTQSNSLTAQLQQIGLRALPTQLDDFLARAAKARWSPHQILEQLAQAEIAERSRLSLERRLRLSGIKRFKPMADFEWSWPAKIEREVSERLTWIYPEARNLFWSLQRLGQDDDRPEHLSRGCWLATVVFRSAAAQPEEPTASRPRCHNNLRTYANISCCNR